MRVLSDVSSYIIFEFTGELAGSAYLVGTQLRPIFVELSGEVDRVGVKLRPGIASSLFGISARDLRDRVVGISDANIRLPSRLQDKRFAGPRFRSRVCALEDWMRGQLAKLKPSSVKALTETTRLFQTVSEGTPVRLLEKLTGWNERRIQRFFLNQFGTSAATLRRWGRFRRALELLEAQNQLSRAIVSAQVGYSDQAHMCREFREFAGTDIGSLLSERQSVGNVQAAGQ